MCWNDGLQIGGFGQWGLHSKLQCIQMEFLDKISMRIMMKNVNTSADLSECSED